MNPTDQELRQMCTRLIGIYMPDQHEDREPNGNPFDVIVVVARALLAKLDAPQRLNSPIFNYEKGNCGPSEIAAAPKAHSKSQHKRLAAQGALVEGWLVFSNEHNAWWRSNRCGYTTAIESAGRYSLTEALDCTVVPTPKGETPDEVVVPSPELVTRLLATPTTELTNAVNAAYERAAKAAKDYIDAAFVVKENFSHEVADAVLALKSQPLPVPSGWISVKDRLPDIGDLVLVYTPSSQSRKVRALMRLLRHEDATDYFWDHTCGQHTCTQNSVTYWMPLPVEPT